MRTVVFIDGQNLYHGAKEAWAPPTGTLPTSRYTWPCYDVEKVAKCLVDRVAGRTLSEIRFYTGVPDRRSLPFWHQFWNNKLRYLKNQGIYVYRGRVNRGGQEKGVDVSIAIDLVRLTYESAYDLAIIVSQDWDFGPAIELARKIAETQKRTLEFESAFPNGPGSQSDRGVPGTTWVKIDKALYDTCFDSREYRPPRR